MIELLVTAHGLSRELVWDRWRILADEYPVSVTLVVPERWESYWFNEREVLSPEPVREDNFRVITLPTTDVEDWSSYFFRSIDNELRELEPDVIYSLHEEHIFVNHQWLLYRNIWCPDAKFIFFSMNALGVPKDEWHQKLRWWHLERNAEAALGHYPGCKRSLRQAGFERPIFMQTQIGLSENLFYPDTAARNAVREELGFDDEFVVGFTGRLVEEKGIFDLIEAMPLEETDWRLLIVGDGDMRGEVEDRIANCGFEHRAHMMGFVEQKEVARYMRAMDCYVLGSHTTDDWIDTFPLSPVQAMATEVPTVVSDSGALPFQVGDAGLVFPEKDVGTLKEHLRFLADNPEERRKIGEACREQVMSKFSAEALAENFFKILVQVYTGEYDYADEGEKYTQYKAH